MGIEADTSSPWRPYEMLCAISCHQVIRNIYDTLAMPTADGKAAPYLAESITPNDDFTEWTVTARAGVTFHDGTPFDGAAIVENITRAKTGALTGNLFRPIDSVAVDPADPMTVVISMNTSWAAFPFALMGQASYMASPAWLLASDADEALRSQPVGTGPFMYEDYKPNEYFKMTKNPNYWNEPYPYLDSVEFRPIPDALSRRDALKSGTVDLMHTTNGETIAEFRDTQEFPMQEITNTAEVGYTLLHVTQDGSPLNDVRVRCALAYASDEQAIIDSISAGVGQIAFGPFSPDQVGYLEDTGFPEAQDMAKAQDLIAEYRAENPGPLNLSLATTQDETNLTIAQFQKQWFEEAGVDSVTIDQIDQGNYILTAVLGQLPGVPVAQPRRHRPRHAVPLVALVELLARRSARTELRPHQGPAARRTARREPGQQRPGPQEGDRRGSQQAVRHAVLQHLGRLHDLGHPPQGRCAGCWRTSRCLMAAKVCQVPVLRARSR